MWDYSARAFQWIPTWQGLVGFQRSLHSCALDGSSLSIGRVKKIHYNDSHLPNKAFNHKNWRFVVWILRHLIFLNMVFQVLFEGNLYLGIRTSNLIYIFLLTCKIKLYLCTKCFTHFNMVLNHVVHWNKQLLINQLFDNKDPSFPSNLLHVISTNFFLNGLQASIVPGVACDLFALNQYGLANPSW